METGEALFAPRYLVCHGFPGKYSYPVPLFWEFVAVCSMEVKKERKREGAGKRKKREIGCQHSYVQISE